MGEEKEEEEGEGARAKRKTKGYLIFPRNKMGAVSE